MFGNAILPPLTFNSNEEQTGQGASVCNKQPQRGGLPEGEGVCLSVKTMPEPDAPQNCRRKATSGERARSILACLKRRGMVGDGLNT